MSRKVHINHLMLQVAGAVFLASVVVVVFLWITNAWSYLADCYDAVCNRENVRSLVQSSGWLAPLLFTGIQVGQVVFAPIPGDVTGFLGGYLFGAWGGFFLSTLGLTLGSMLNFYIGHFLGERVVRRFVDCKSYDKYNELVQYKGILVIFIFFLLPFFPKDYLCLFLGMTTLPATVFFVVSTVGRLPGTLALTLQGASVFQKDYMFFISISVLSILFTVGAYMGRQPVYRWMERKRKKASCCQIVTPQAEENR